MTSSVGRTPLVMTTRGSVTITASIVAMALWEARPGTRPASRTLEWAAVATRASAVPKSVTAVLVTHDRRRHRWCMTTTPSPAKAAAITVRTNAVSYTHLRAHETVLDLVCRLLLEKK